MPGRTAASDLTGPVTVATGPRTTVIFGDAEHCHFSQTISVQHIARNKPDTLKCDTTPAINRSVCTDG